MPSIIKILAGAMAGRERVRFSGVLFKLTHSSRTFCAVALIRGLIASCSSQGFILAQGAVNTTAARRGSRHNVIPAYHAPWEKPHNATAGQPLPSSQPV